MLDSEDTELAVIEARLEADDPRFVRAVREGRPRRPREYDRRRAWAGVTAGLVLLGIGVLTAHGMLIAIALVATGAACHLFDPPPRGGRRRS
ncbi:DUF3040 domain-containing protein [Streptomyces sp. SID5785]|uniref:DUF3040 domain-containing protein n=1 Tax=Streptomyces sp. SID5785 TaxID=2690309 RepID=UPI0013616555|nr:DUF3040 domain-containing protein [Streptomyces sp. SID5785]MZD04305.1 DUF3040 domain-containing protein [Streptomyces sp. SID5785]